MELVFLHPLIIQDDIMWVIILTPAAGMNKQIWCKYCAQKSSLVLGFGLLIVLSLNGKWAHANTYITLSYYTAAPNWAWWCLQCLAWQWHTSRSWWSYMALNGLGYNNSALSIKDDIIALRLCKLSDQGGGMNQIWSFLFLWCDSTWKGFLQFCSWSIVSESIHVNFSHKLERCKQLSPSPCAHHSFPQELIKCWEFEREWLVQWPIEYPHTKEDNRDMLWCSMSTSSILIAHTKWYSNKCWMACTLPCVSQYYAPSMHVYEYSWINT